MLKLNYDKSIKRRFIQALTFLFRRKDLKRLKVDYNLLVKIIKYAFEKHKNQEDDKFIECFLLLGNKLIVDIQSAKILCERGLYGSAYAILAVILRSARMIAALYLKEDLITDYLDEEKNSDSNKGFMRKFSESGLQKVIDERFGKFERGMYANIEKSLHGSSVGIKIYYSRVRHNKNGTKGGDLIYDAFFEDEKSAAVINILCGAIIDVCGVFIERYEKEKGVRNLKLEYEQLLREELKALVKSKIRLDLLDARRKGD